MRREVFGILSALVLVVSLGLALAQTTMPVRATSSGPNSGSTAVDENSIGTVVWSTLSNALTQDDSYATASLGKGAVSHYLKVTNLGFSIPSGATIEGIVVEVDRYAENGDKVDDNSVRLVKGGAVGGDNKASASLWPSSDTDTYVSYGSPTDLWGLAWAPADINGSDSGVAVSAKKTDQGNSNRIAYVDHIRITVYYNQAPTNIGLSNGSVAENQPINTVVGTFSTTDPDAGDTFTYTLASGTGDTDNASFSIDGSGLRTSASFDYETKNSYSIRARSTDQGGLYLEKQFTITITSVNETPTDIGLSSSTVAENQPINTVVGTFSTTDPDAGDTFTYTLASGTGDTDNASFNIDGSGLRTSASFDYETKNSYSIRVRSTDQGGLYFEKQFTIAVTNVNEVPVADPQSGLTVDSCKTLTVTLTGSDPDNDPLTYMISTLPIYGDLFDGTGTGGTKVTAVPYTVTDPTHNVTYKPSVTYSVGDTFGFKVNDGELDSAEATISMSIDGCDDLDYYDDWVYYCNGDSIWRTRDFHDFYCLNGTCLEDIVPENEWYEDCPADYYTDWVYYCNGDSIWRTRDFHDYYCLNGTCLEDIVPENEWYEDCPADYYTDWVYYCNGDSIWRTRDFHDFYCLNGTCHEDVTPENEWYEDCPADYYTDWVYYCNGDSIWRTRDFHDYYCLNGTCLEDIVPENEWYEDCPADYYTDWVYYCNGDSIWRTRDFHDYYCLNGTCLEDIVPENEWYEDCPADYYTDWVYYCNGDSIWRTRDFHDYYCFNGTCQEDVIPDSEWCEDCDDGDPCTIDTCENGQCVHTPRYTDISEYYRGLYDPPDEVSTLELLAAVDDWIADVAPPCFEEPITTLQLLELVDEWLTSV